MSYHDDRDNTPGWNGDPATWDEFEEKVRFFKLASDMSRARSFAASIVLKLSGTAKSVAKEMPDVDLLPFAPIIPAEGEGADQYRKPHHWAYANAKGVDNLMKKLKDTLCIQKPIMKAQRLAEFFETRKYWRKKGQRMA